MSTYRWITERTEPDLSHEYEAILRSLYPEDFVDSILANDESVAVMFNGDIEHEGYGDLIIRFVDGPDSVAVMGLLSKSGKLKLSDAAALRSWLARLREALDAGKDVYVSLNKMSEPLFMRALKDGNFKIEQLSSHDFPFGSWKTIRVRSVFEEAKKKLVDDLDQWDSGVWIHYSEFPELKINPKQFHQDPVGIYLFPEGFKTIGRWERMKYKFRVKLKRSLNILDISKLSLEQCLQILRQLIPADQWSEATVLEARDFRDAFWEVMKNYFVLSQSGPSSKAAWNKALREIGYDAVFDDTASIHSAEVQLLVLDPSAVQVVERIDQKATGFAEIDDLAGRLGKMLEPYGEVTIERPKSKKDWYSGKRELSASVSVKSGDRGLGFSIYPYIQGKDSTPESITVYLKSGAREFRSIMSRAESFQWKDRPWSDLSRLEKLVKQAAAEEFAVKEDQEIFTDPTGKFWGNAGAGGLFYAEDTGRYLISKRSQAVNEPNTWGTWGGKLDADETPEEAIVREIEEETGYRGKYRLEWLYTYKSGNFEFDNYLIIVPHEFEPKHSWETSDHAWVDFGEWPKPLHFGMKSLIPHLKDRRTEITEPSKNQL